MTNFETHLIASALLRLFSEMLTHDLLEGISSFLRDLPLKTPQNMGLW